MQAANDNDPQLHAIAQKITQSRDMLKKLDDKIAEIEKKYTQKEMALQKDKERELSSIRNQIKSANDTIERLLKDQTNRSRQLEALHAKELKDAA